MTYLKLTSSLCTVETCHFGWMLTYNCFREDTLSDLRDLNINNMTKKSWNTKRSVIIKIVIMNA